MVFAADVVHAVGPSLLDLTVPAPDGEEVRDVLVAEPADAQPGDTQPGDTQPGDTQPGDRWTGQRGDLVLGIAVGTPQEAVTLLERSQAHAASGVALRRALAGDADVRAAADRLGLPLLALGPGISWAHLVWLLRGLLDRAAAPEPLAAGTADVHNDLFALADAAAAIVDAPVTIEDNRSRVLAYSSGQSHTDTARVSTIVGRRVPQEVVERFRGLGVFRRLARSSEPFLIPERPDGMRPRLVVPVRAGGEWLGSIWAVVEGTVDDATTAELRNAAAVVALHLLRLRAEADVSRRSATDRLRTALRTSAPGRVPEVPLPPGPWRVVALGSPPRTEDAEQRLELWEVTARRHGWVNPLLADVDGVVLAVVSEQSSGGSVSTAGAEGSGGSGRPAGSGGSGGSAGSAGSWPWLRRLAEGLHGEDGATCAAAGGLVTSVAELPFSRAEAVKLLGLLERQPELRPTQRIEDAWDALTIQRAVDALDPDGLPGPLALLVAHDAEHRSEYVETLGAWLAHYGEPQRAARDLLVHPNTLRYRMRRLQELAVLDLTNPRQRLALRLQIEAWRSS